MHLRAQELCKSVDSAIANRKRMVSNRDFVTFEIVSEKASRVGQQDKDVSDHKIHWSKSQCTPAFWRKALNSKESVKAGRSGNQSNLNEAVLSRWLSWWEYGFRCGSSSWGICVKFYSEFKILEWEKINYTIHIMSFSLYQWYTIFYPFIKLLIAGQGTHWLGFDSNHHLCLSFPARHLFQRAVVRFKLISFVWCRITVLSWSRWNKCTSSKYYEYSWLWRNSILSSVRKCCVPSL